MHLHMAIQGSLIPRLHSFFQLRESLGTRLLLLLRYQCILQEWGIFRARPNPTGGFESAWLSRGNSRWWPTAVRTAGDYGQAATCILSLYSSPTVTVRLLNTTPRMYHCISLWPARPKAIDFQLVLYLAHETKPLQWRADIISVSLLLPPPYTPNHPRFARNAGSRKRATRDCHAGLTF